MSTTDIGDDLLNTAAGLRPGLDSLRGCPYVVHGNLMPFYRRKLPHLQRDFKRHFVTFCTYERWVLPDWARAIVLRSCLHDNDVMHFLHVALVMPDHVHLIFTPLINEQKKEFFSLAQIMCRIKGASGQLIHQQMNQLGRVWQTESFDHVLRSSESLDAKIAYILENPVRAGLVSEWKQYPWIWVRREKDARVGTASQAVPAKRSEPEPCDPD